MKRNKKLKGILFFSIVLTFLIFSAVYYLMNQENLGRRSDNFIGDGLCGNLHSENDRDSCCKNFHAGDFHIDCLGNWKYFSAENLCEFVCENSLPSCTQELRVCENGRIVSRNSSRECEFNPC